MLKVKVQIEVTKSHMTSLLCYPPPGYDMNTMSQLIAVFKGDLLKRERKE